MALAERRKKEADVPGENRMHYGGKQEASDSVYQRKLA